MLSTASAQPQPQPAAGMAKAVDHSEGASQKVTVEHVHAHAGGQAVVGNVVRPGGGDRGTVIDVIPEISPEELERNDFDAATVRRAEAA